MRFTLGARSVLRIGLFAVLSASVSPAGNAAPLQHSEASQKLRSGFHNPMPGGQMAGYPGDTGLDISGHKLPVYAIASGKLDYAERGHTVWRRPKDTDFCVRIELDQPIPFRGRHVTHIYYAHLSSVQTPQPEGALERRHVAAGERLGISGVANGVYHLHLGFILDGRIDQEYYDDIVREWDVRALLGGYRKGEHLPNS